MLLAVVDWTTLMTALVPTIAVLLLTQAFAYKKENRRRARELEDRRYHEEKEQKERDRKDALQHEERVRIAEDTKKTQEETRVQTIKALVAEAQSIKQNAVNQATDLVEKIEENTTISKQAFDSSNNFNKKIEVLAEKTNDMCGALSRRLEVIEHWMMGILNPNRNEDKT